MNKKLLLWTAAALLFGGFGCVNYPNPMPDKSPVAFKNPMHLDLPMRWVALLGKDVDTVAKFSTLDAVKPFPFLIPCGFGAAGSGFDSIICVNPTEVSARFFTRMNMPGARLPFWRHTILRVLIEQHNYKIILDEGFKTTENINAWRVTGIKTIVNKKTGAKKDYKYKLVMAIWGDTLYMAECYGRIKAFDAAEKSFDKAISTMDLAFWRIIHQPPVFDPFFFYDNVAVHPQHNTGIWCPSWTPLQLGFFPYGQIFCSTSNVYGLGFDLFFLNQNRTCGISYGLFNAVKENYGIHLAPLVGATEKNCGLSIGVLYNNIRVNNGLSIGLVNRAEEESHGVQLGLLNFNSSPDYPFFMPIINFPFFALFR